MIHEINEQQFKDAEILIELSRNGTHLLFPNLGEIKEILSENIELASHDLIQAESVFAQLLKKPSVHMKREYLATLPEITRKNFIRAYFHVVEAQILQALKHPH